MSNILIKINLDRIEYLRKIFALTQEELLIKASEVGTKLKSPLTKEDVFSNNIKLNTLKRIDKLFNKKLSFYTNPASPPESHTKNIFFRKNQFAFPLEFSDRLRIHEQECILNYMQELCILSGIEIPRTLDKYTINDNPREIAQKIRKKLFPTAMSKRQTDRDFLIMLIEKLADENIVVSEFHEQWNTKEKSNFNGCFIQPNFIILKRQQKSLKREIFTLAHELGHYLLDIEEIDAIFAEISEKKIEKWCDSFAFTFLTGINTYDKKISSAHDGAIKEFSEQHHISRLALFTHLALNKKISWPRYNELKEELQNSYAELAQKDKAEIEQKRKKAEQEGKPLIFGQPVLIASPLEKSIYSSAYFDGIIEEIDVLQRFKTKDIDTILYG